MKMILLIALLFPIFAGANEIRVSNNGSIYNETSASASSGGQSAAAGQSVESGDVSSSSHVETYINAGNEGGTVQVKVETSQNGETETQEYTEEIEPGKPVRVDVSAKSDSDGSNVEMRVNGESTEGEDVASSTDESKEINALARVTALAKVEHALSSIPSFFKKVFNFFWSW